MKKILHRIREGMPSKSRVAGAIQGVIGDKLPKSMQITMQFVADGKPIAVPKISKSHACIFVHGSADTEAGWQTKKGEFNFGDQLLLDFSISPLYIRYNSGLAVSANGEAFAKLLTELFAVNKALKKLSLIGHSMGGLVIHSAIYHARAQQLGWVSKVRQVFLLGTPHAGAPLAKLAEKGEQILQFIPNPITLIAASVIGLRSKGLKDLSQGQRGLPAEGKILLPKVQYVFVAGGLQKMPSGILNRLIGDGMVRKPSAQRISIEQKLQSGGGHANQSGESWLRKALPWVSKAPQVHVETVPGASHLALRTAPEVYGVIRGHFKS